MNPPSLRDTTSDETIDRDRFHPVLDVRDGVEAVPTGCFQGNRLREIPAKADRRGPSPQPGRVPRVLDQRASVLGCDAPAPLSPLEDQFDVLMTPPSSTLVIGIGNPTRQDDAAGPLLAQKIHDLSLPDVEVQITQQLTPEMAADWAKRRRVLIIDAAVTGPEVDLREIFDTPSAPAAAASHTANPGTLAALAAQLYGHRPNIWLCTLHAQSLEFGTEPTRTMFQRIETAEEQLLQWFIDFS